MNRSLRTPACLLAAVASGSLVGCGASREEAEDPNPSGGGSGTQEEADPYAEARVPPGDFLSLYAQTGRFRYGHPRAFRFLPDGSALLYLRSEARSPLTRLFALDLESGQERVLLSAADLLQEADEEVSDAEQARLERLRLTATGIARYELSRDGARLLVPLSGRLFLVDRARIGEADAIRELGAAVAEPGSEATSPPIVDARFSPDGAHVAFVRDGDLYAVDLDSGRQTRLTTRADDETEYGLAEFVAQEEMRRFEGFWWAPNGERLVVQRTRVEGMERMHILDPAHPERPPRSTPYPRAGGDNAEVQLALVPRDGGELRFIDWDREAFPYVAKVLWPTAGPLTLLVQDRLQEKELLLAVDPESGETREFLQEERDTWIDLDPSVPRWLSDGQQFLWASDRTGSWRLELRNAEGSLVRILTPDRFGYRELLGVDEGAEVAWVLASAEPTTSHVFRVPLSGEGEPERVTPEGPAVHTAVVDTTAGLWIHHAHPLEGERTRSVRRLGGEELVAVPDVAEPIPLEISVSLDTVGAREWRVAVVRPSDFEEGKEYPVILHVYGGPTHRMVSADRHRYALDQWMADHHVIVVRVDGRGTPGRGSDWQRAVEGDLAGPVLEDQVIALQQVGDRYPELDMERVGVWGWSYGGYMAAMAVLRRPDVFRAAVAGAPVTDWRDYDTHYTERYLGLPGGAGQGEDAYTRSSALAAARAEADAADHRPLLSIHGTADDNVYLSHSLKLQEALLRAGRPAELLTLAGQTHMVPDPELSERMHERVMAFFEAHLRR